MIWTDNKKATQYKASYITVFDVTYKYSIGVSQLQLKEHVVFVNCAIRNISGNKGSSPTCASNIKDP